MRNIYTDEAGTSALERVSVVVALLVHADTKWFPVIKELNKLAGQIPKQYRSGFVFHAKNITAHNKYPDWPETQRREFMRAVMNLPHQFDIPIAVGAIRRGTQDWSNWPEKKMTAAQIDHYFAFTLCMWQADEYLRLKCGNEMGQVIAEDIPEMRRFLRSSVNTMRTAPFQMRMVTLVNDRYGVEQPETFKVERIVDEVHFLERENAPFLQIADACAFGMRRYLSAQKQGHEYLEAITGQKGLKLSNYLDGLRANFFSWIIASDRSTENPA